MPTLTTPPQRLASLGAMAGGAALIAGGAIHLTAPDQVQTGETVETALAHVLLALLTFALLALVPAMLRLAAYAGTRRSAIVATLGMTMVAVATTVSNILGEDRLFFFVTAPAGNVIWLLGTIGLAVALHRARAVPAWMAIALPFIQVLSLPLSNLGGSIVGGAFWIAVGYLMSADRLQSPAGAAARVAVP